MKYNKITILFCIFLFISITPISASLQSDINTTITQKSNDTNSLLDTLKNNNTTEKGVTNNTQVSNNGNNFNKSVELLKKPTITNESQIEDDLAQIIEYSKTHNISVTDENNTLLGTMIRINSIDDLKPGDIISYLSKVPGIVNSLQFYLLITSIQGTGTNINYCFYTIDLDDKNIKKYTGYTQDDFTNFLGYNVTEQTLVFRADTSLYTLNDNGTEIYPKKQLEDILRSFNNESIEIEENDAIVPDTAKELWWLWGLIPGITTAIQLPFTWKLIVQKYRKCCCGTPSEEEIALLRQTRELRTLATETREMKQKIEYLYRDIGRMSINPDVSRIETELRIISDDIRHMDLPKLEREMQNCHDPIESAELRGKYNSYDEAIRLKQERIIDSERKLDDLRRV